MHSKSGRRARGGGNGENRKRGEGAGNDKSQLGNTLKLQPQLGFAFTVGPGFLYFALLSSLLWLMFLSVLVLVLLLLLLLLYSCTVTVLWPPLRTVGYNISKK